MQAFFCAKSVLAPAGAAANAPQSAKPIHPRILQPFNLNISTH
jgi:hypothetical protein